MRSTVSRYLSRLSSAGPPAPCIRSRQKGSNEARAVVLVYLDQKDSEEILVRRETLEVRDGALSYIDSTDERGHRTYIPLHRVKRFRYGTL